MFAYREGHSPSSAKQKDTDPDLAALREVPRTKSWASKILLPSWRRVYREAEYQRLDTGGSVAAASRSAGVTRKFCAERCERKQ